MHIHRIVPNEYQGELDSGKRFRLHRVGRKWQVTTWHTNRSPGPDDETDGWPTLQAALDELQRAEGNASFSDAIEDWLPVLAGSDGSDCQQCALQPVAGVLSHTPDGAQQALRPCPCQRYTVAEARLEYGAWENRPRPR